MFPLVFFTGLGVLISMMIGVTWRVLSLPNNPIIKEMFDASAGSAKREAICDFALLFMMISAACWLGVQVAAQAFYYASDALEARGICSRETVELAFRVLVFPLAVLGWHMAEWLRERTPGLP